MLYRAQGAVRAIEHLMSNRFLAALPPDDLAILDPHLRTVPLERGVILHEAGGDIEQVYFPHSGMVSLVAVMESGATVEPPPLAATGSSVPPQRWDHEVHLGAPSFSCRARPPGCRLRSFAPRPGKAMPSATSPCAITIS
jgi:hypothetical protein